jgi:diguanylate cyclase (GGDEF)-like protein
MFPSGRRIAAVPLRAATGPSGHGLLPEPSITLVAEFGGAGLRGGQVERRTVSSAAQAGATAALALSRAQLLADARRAAVTDGLTGLANRRHFDQTMEAFEQAWRENGVPFALLLTDVDHFKSVNDRYGHRIGDRVLMAVASTLARHATGGALAARYGGEEFALVIPGADAAAAATIAERVRRAIREISEPVSVSSSFGVASVPEDAAGADDVILAADAALLQAKALGRDRVVVYEPTAPVLG